MVVLIIDLIKFNFLFLFIDEERDWGCERYLVDMKKELDIGESYYEIKINGMLIRKKCLYKDCDYLVYVINCRKISLERVVVVYMEEVKLCFIYF